MGRVLCKRHGKSGMNIVCFHISKAMSSGIKLEKIIEVDFNLGDFPGEIMVPIEETIFYCSDCVKLRDFPPENCELPDSNYSSMLKVGFGGVCNKCFNEFTDDIVFKEIIDY